MYSTRKRLTLSEYLSGILNQDRITLSKAITLVESSLSQDQLLAEELIQEVMPYTGKSIRVGITGVPGVGKSTFIDTFGEHLIQQGHRLAVLTIDPSSQKTKGSILGDKTRMEKLALNKMAFIRPSPAGATLGGVGARTREAMLLCEAAGYDMVIVETVGVGQSETVVSEMVDFFLLLILAGAGDELQGIKKGIIETADALVVTKADGENLKQARLAKKEYERALHLFPLKENKWKPKVRLCSALDNVGMDEIGAMINDFIQKIKSTSYFDENRSKQRLSWMHGHIKWLLESSFYQHPEVKKRLHRISPLVEKGDTPSMGMARLLVEEFLRDIKNNK